MMNNTESGTSRACALFCAALVSILPAVPHARDRGVNQPGAAGKVAADSGVDQTGAAGNRGVGRR
jgi:tripartite-type tricarboxylate transporter receptor subunit TctC